LTARQRVSPRGPPRGGPFVLVDNESMTDDQLLRYSRHILLEELGVEGQERVLAAHALVVGAGGLGSPVALYLGTAGVGRITLVDHDSVDLTNLQRQIAHNMQRVGQPKALSARRKYEKRGCRKPFTSFR